MLVLVGIGAGMLTTVVGLGGGALLVAGLAAAWHDPVRALAVTTPALLVGNSHRAWWFRREVPLRSLVGFVAPAFAGALVGGALALALPPWVVSVALVGSGALVLLRSTGRLRVAVSGTWLPVAGAGVGVLSTAGGGLLAGPVLLAAGSTGGAYVGSVAVTAAAMHVGRLLALSAGGATTPTTWTDALILGASIPVGNVLGARLRDKVPASLQPRLEVVGALAVVALAVLGGA